MALTHFSRRCLPENLGSAAFRADYGIRYAYVAGSMYRGIASVELVARMGQAGMIGFIGTGGCSLAEIEGAIRQVQSRLSPAAAYGANLIANYDDPETEMAVAELCVRLGVRRIEASAFMQITPALVWYRLTGLSAGPAGEPVCGHQILAKLSRPEVAEAFLRPAPEKLVAALLAEGRITAQQAAWAAQVPMSHDLCVEADSAGHTDQGVAMVLLPTIQRLRDRLHSANLSAQRVRVGLAGGIGTPEAAAAAFVMGADFILTGSINQCTVEAATSDLVKDMLQEMNIQDTTYAPAGDLFEAGARVQVLRRGVFFPARANRLFALYNQYGGLAELPAAVRQQLEEKYFGQTLDAVWEQTKTYLRQKGSIKKIEQAQQNEKFRMSLVFRWYFAHSFRVARNGSKDRQVDFQIHTGPALGAFNQWVKGTRLEDWRNRHADEIGEKLMTETAQLLGERLEQLAPA